MATTSPPSPFTRDGLNDALAPMTERPEAHTAPLEPGPTPALGQRQVLPAGAFTYPAAVNPKVVKPELISAWGARRVQA